ncbi:hypothetical protein H4CHR_00999 [Variovorax sp. PBS-H4]|uniref:hypothetical protein n=1 Tax=Variovorax sp. PBS-H4 TaxID=434008 RepID=UPI001315F9CE|nr:hypothetical protein [Variovorax sp. PBS-H4]VTU22490.1 hypothetical protein H4CHR_00999 [Variovorax sp. PBS-H4]
MTVLVMPLLFAACAAPPAPPPEPVAVQPPPPPPPPPPVQPVEAEPMAPATQPALVFAQLTQGPVAALLGYADKVRPLAGNELANEISRLGEPGEQPLVQMQLALLLAQTRVPADLARALGLVQRVIANSATEAQPLHSLARLLAARYQEQRRVEDERDRQAQQVRDSQRRIDQLSDRIEALRAIERSFSRPNSPPPVAPAAPKPAP